MYIVQNTYSITYFTINTLSVSRPPEHPNFSMIDAGTKLCQHHGTAVEDDNSRYLSQSTEIEKRKLAFIRYLDSMDLRCVDFEVHKAFEYELRTFIAGK